MDTKIILDSKFKNKLCALKTLEVFLIAWVFILSLHSNIYNLIHKPQVKIKREKNSYLYTIT